MFIKQGQMPETCSFLEYIFEQGAINAANVEKNAVHLLYYEPHERSTMRKPKEQLVFWQRSFGWRAGSRYSAPSASAADVIRYEQEELGNTLDVPPFLLTELDRAQYMARDVIWICKSREHARRYSGRGKGVPYKEDMQPHSLILATDGEAETGYLVLQNARRLTPEVVQQFAAYRQERRSRGEFPHPPTQRPSPPFRCDCFTLFPTP